MAGPDGFSAVVPLEAAGAGTYTGSLPLSRPGAYVATAVDEISSEALGTTAAALSAGEELRPTGTDRGLLRQISQVTGGKQRDTLAGIFSDREALRFAYQNLDSFLTVLAASLLLLGVAGRRLALPGFLRATSASFVWLRRTPSMKTAQARGFGHGSPSQSLDAPPRAVGTHGAPSNPDRRSIAESQSPGGAPRFASQPALSAEPGQVRAGSSSRPAARPATAAQILLARRRGRKS